MKKTAPLFQALVLYILSALPAQAQTYSFTVEPRVNLGWFFPVQTTCLAGQDFVNSTSNYGPLSVQPLVVQDGSKKFSILAHGGIGLDLFYNIKKSPNEYNWSVGGSFFMQNQVYAIDVPDVQYKGNETSAFVDYYRYLSYKLSLRKYWTSAQARDFFVQFSGIFSNHFQANDNTWANIHEGLTDYTDNGTGYTIYDHAILKNNFLVEAQFGTSIQIYDQPILLSAALCVPLNQYIYKSDFTYYVNGVPQGVVQAKQSQLALWMNLSVPIEVKGWNKKVKEPKPPKHFDDPVIPIARKNDRKQNVQHSYSTKNKTLLIEIFDNASADGDTASLDFNGEWVLENYPVEKEPRQLTIELKEGENSLALYAISLGTTPPNTAAITIIDGDIRKTFVLNSDYSHCGTLRIYKEP